MTPNQSNALNRLRRVVPTDAVVFYGSKVRPPQAVMFRVELGGTSVKGAVAPDGTIYVRTTTGEARNAAALAVINRTLDA